MNGLLTTLHRLTLTFIMIISLATLIHAQPSELYSSRWRAPSTVTAMQGPYTWMDTVNCASADYSTPSGYLICEVRVTDSCIMKVKLRSKDSIFIRAVAGDIFRLDLLKVYKVGTDSLSRFGNKIRVFGIKE